MVHKRQITDATNIYDAILNQPGTLKRFFPLLFFFFAPFHSCLFVYLSCSIFLSLTVFVRYNPYVFRHPARVSEVRILPLLGKEIDSGLPWNLLSEAGKVQRVFSSLKFITSPESMYRSSLLLRDFSQSSLISRLLCVSCLMLSAENFIKPVSIVLVVNISSPASMRLALSSLYHMVALICLNGCAYLT